MIPANNKERCAAFPFETGIHFRRKTDFFPEEDATMSYSGFEPTRLQTEATRGLSATDLVILNLGQVTRTTPELEPLLLTTTSRQRVDDRFNEHRSPTRDPGLELITRQPRVRDLDHWTTTADDKPKMDNANGKCSDGDLSSSLFEFVLSH
ncbi:hypothetical protein TNCV_143911 [Trichonephila clavipes]|nr:hypothetical protein TNCV_143911 [Trichonephila clavipes]